jgi:hypothetical protein
MPFASFASRTLSGNARDGNDVTMERSAHHCLPMTPTHAELTRRWHRVVTLVESLPEATATGEDHLSLEVRGKRFAWLLDDHHGDARLALHCKAPPGANQALTKAAPDRFHLPPYLARHGWVGVWLDLPVVDWEEVRGLLTEAYRVTAPKGLAAKLEGVL